MKRRRLAVGLTDALRCSPYFSKSLYKMYQLRRTYTVTHSFSRGLPSAREGHKPSDSLGLLARRKTSSPHANCKALECLFKIASRARRCRRRGAGSWRMGPWGRVVWKHSSPGGQRWMGRQQERGEEFSLGLSLFMIVFPHVLAG